MQSKGMPLTKDGEVVKQVIEEGHGDTPKKLQEVVVHYTGRLQDGKVFDSTGARSTPFKFVLGIGHVVKGLDLGIATMRKGERANLSIGSNYAYGAKGSSSLIPPNSRLDYEIELVDFHNKRKPILDLSDAEKQQIGEEYKATGNAYFKAQKLKEAAYCYTEGINVVNFIGLAGVTTASKNLWLALHLNLCICLNGLQNWPETHKYTTKVLDKDPNNPKAHYLRGVAARNMQQYADAIQDLTIALAANPSDDKVKAELALAKQKKDEALHKEKQVYSKMFASSVPTIAPASGALPYDPTNPRVYLDIQCSSESPQRLVIELFAKTMPKTANTFKCLCTGELTTESQPLHYKGSKLQILATQGLIQGGDLGPAASSIAGKYFEDEICPYTHNQKGLLGVASSAANGNGSQFYITLQPVPSLDGKHVIFGRIILGMQLLLQLESFGSSPSAHDIVPLISRMHRVSVV